MKMEYLFLTKLTDSLNSWTTGGSVVSRLKIPALRKQCYRQLRPLGHQHWGPNGNPTSSQSSRGPLCWAGHKSSNTFSVDFFWFSISHISLFSFQYDFTLLNIKDLTKHFGSFIPKINSHDNRVELANQANHSFDDTQAIWLHICKWNVLNQHGLLGPAFSTKPAWLDQARMTPFGRSPERNIIGPGCDLTPASILAQPALALRTVWIPFGKLNDHVFLDICLNTYFGGKEPTKFITAFLPLLLSLYVKTVKWVF